MPTTLLHEFGHYAGYYLNGVQRMRSADPLDLAEMHKHQEIAKYLNVSVATVSTALPYEDKVDNTLEPTEHAVKVREYRAYEKKLKMQMIKPAKTKEDEPMKGETMEDKSMKNKTMPSVSGAVESGGIISPARQRNRRTDQCIHRCPRISIAGRRNIPGKKRRTQACSRPLKKLLRMQAVNTLAEKKPFTEKIAGMNRKPRYDVAKNIIPSP